MTGISGLQHCLMGRKRDLFALATALFPKAGLGHPQFPLGQGNHTALTAVPTNLAGGLALVLLAGHLTGAE